MLSVLLSFLAISGELWDQVPGFFPSERNCLLIGAIPRLEAIDLIFDYSVWDESQRSLFLIVLVNYMVILGREVDWIRKLLLGREIFVVVIAHSVLACFGSTKTIVTLASPFLLHPLINRWMLVFTLLAFKLL